MALQPSGVISVSDIEGEFGGSAPTSLSEYYRGGGLVTSNNTGVPEAGQISVSNFYSAAGLRTMYEQVLTGSGTFTPLYAGAKAIIQIGGGGGSSGNSCSNNGTDYSIYGYGAYRSGSGAGDSIFVENIDDFNGGSYSQGAGGQAYTFSTGGFDARNGYNGNASYLNSPSNSPWTITAGSGGGGAPNSNTPAGPNNPMSGTYPTGSSGLPDEVIYNGTIIDPATFMNISSGGAGIYGSYIMGVTYQPTSNGSPAGSAGFLRIYYLVE
jgi:hypothetical protein